MAQPGNVPPPLEPTPFSRPAEARPARSGCGRVALIGCGALIVIVGICAIVFFMNAQRFAGKMLTWSFGKLEQQIFANMAPDVTPEERERLRTAFSDALTAASSGKAQPKDLQAIQGEVMQIAQRGKGQVSREDVRRLTEALEAVAGKGAAGPGGAGGTEPMSTGTEPPG